MQLSYTQPLYPRQCITIEFMPEVEAIYTFTGVWGSHPIGTPEERIIKVANGGDNSNLNSIPTIDDPALSDTTEPTDQPSDSFEGTYIVQPGDTLSGIAERFNTTVDKIAAYNSITDTRNIQAGQVLNIPPQDYVIPKRTAPNESEPTVTDSVPVDAEASDISVTEPTTGSAEDSIAAEKESITEPLPADTAAVSEPVSEG